MEKFNPKHKQVYYFNLIELEYLETEVLEYTSFYVLKHIESGLLLDIDNFNRRNKR
jgi:hypothetical protein